MKLVRNLFDKVEPLFEKDGKLHRLFYAYDAFKTLAFQLPTPTRSGSHIRDAMDSKRMMFTVVLALIPCLLFGIYNTGYQRLLALGEATDFWLCIGLGLRYVLPILIVSYVVGLGLEFMFAVIRKEEVSEGYLVTGLLVPLIVPPTLPLWQLVIAVAFGVIIGKEIFGGTGMNIFNPALVIRAFLFFAYPAQISGDLVWVAVDGITTATPLAVSAEGGALGAVDLLASQGFTFQNMLVGLIPGSVGETSVIAIALGAVFLLVTGVGSWRIMVGMLLGGVAMALGLNAMAPDASSILALPVHYHLALGGFAFGLVFMATDPVSAAGTATGKWIYGILTGILAMLARVLNPAFPEGVMLAILFMNMFAPLIDHFVVQANKKRRLQRAA